MNFKYLTRSLRQVSGQVPLRIILVVPFVLEIFGTVGLVGYLSFRNGQEAVNDLATQLRREITTRIEQHLFNYLEQPHLITQLNADAAAIGELNIDDFPGVAHHFWRQMQLFTLMREIYLGDESGKFLGVLRREQNSTFELKISENFPERNFYGLDSQGERTKLLKTDASYDARIRPWYKVALQQGKPTWSKVYTFVDSGTLGITASQPFWDQTGRFRGIMAVSLNLGRISEFLQSIEVSASGQTFIIDRAGTIVGTSTDEKPFTITKDNKRERVQAIDSQNPLTAATAAYLSAHFGELSEIANGEQLSFTMEGDRQFVQVQPYQNPRGLDWLIVVVVPETDFMAQINANTRTAIALCLGALVIAIILGMLTSRWIVQPILQLKDAATALSAGEFDRTVKLERSDELGVLAKAFNSMADQLQASFTTLSAKNAELQRLDQLKNEFLANTSYELRTPLNGIIGIAESLIDGAAGELPIKAKTNLTMIVSSGRRLSNLINDILDFSKLRHQHIELFLKPVGVREIAEVVLTLSQSLVGKKDLQLINSISADIPLVDADENRLQQIFYNLIGNAIKFTESGQVEISASLMNEQWERSPMLAITVTDTGIGIPADKLDRIFASFEQGDGSTARTYGGTGLGLAVTKQLVELHGGTIHVSSTIGSGSQFTFTLPVSDNSIDRTSDISTTLALAQMIGQGRQTETISTGSRAESGDLKIMIVDDEPVNLQVLVNHLELQNYGIIQASSGPEALEILEKGYHKPDLILLDVMMPRMTGYEVTRKIRETFSASELPILLLTAKNQVSDLVIGLEAGANDYLTKPIAKDELLARITTHINLVRLRSENLRLAAELDITRQLQQMLLPKARELEEIEGLEIAGFMEPADEVGGDYYDVLSHNGKVKIGIGDVTGHGLESGVLTIMAQMAVRTLLTNNETNPTQFLSVLNQAIYGNVMRMSSDKHMTLSLLDYEGGTLCVTGQHEDMIVVRSDGRTEQIDTLDLGFPIALEEDITDFVGETRVHLNSGDVVVLYTDGITEAENSQKELYGLERLIAVVKHNRWRSASEIQQAVVDDVRQHIGDHKVYDDITLLVLKQK
ncbi:MAG: SpoIIE family protein phosphatase [Hormoscilla sp.]